MAGNGSLVGGEIVRECGEKGRRKTEKNIFCDFLLYVSIILTKLMWMLG